MIKLDDDELAFTTDGCSLPDVEVKVIDVDGTTLPANQVGKLMVHSCSPRSTEDAASASLLPS